MDLTSLYRPEVARDLPAGSRAHVIAQHSLSLLENRVFNQTPILSSLDQTARAALWQAFQAQYLPSGGNNGWHLCLALARFLHADDKWQCIGPLEYVTQELLTCAMVDWARLDKGPNTECVMVNGDSPTGRGVYGIKRVDLQQDLALMEIEWESFSAKGGLWVAETQNAEALQDDEFYEFHMLRQPVAV